MRISEDNLIASSKVELSNETITTNIYKGELLQVIKTEIKDGVLYFENALVKLKTK